MFRKSTATAALLVLCLSGVAGTASAGEWFVGAAAGRSQLKFEQAGFDGTDSLFAIVGGYRFLRYLAVEAQYIDAGSPSDELAGLQFDVNSDLVTASVLGILPLGKRWALMAKAGYAYYDLEFAAEGFLPEDQSGEKLLYGLGAEMALGERFLIRAEYQRVEVYEGSVDTVDLATLSGIFKFTM